MNHPESADSQRADRAVVGRRVQVEFRGAQLSSDGGLLVMREFDEPTAQGEQRHISLCEVQQRAGHTPLKH